MTEHLQIFEPQIETLKEFGYHDFTLSGGSRKPSPATVSSMKHASSSRKESENSKSVGVLVEQLSQKQDINPLVLLAEVLATTLNSGKRANRSVKHKKLVGTVGELVLALSGDSQVDQIGMLFEVGSHISRSKK